MKLSLAWIFDHIDANWKDISVDDLVARFNATTAETEGFEPIVFELDTMTMARLERVDADSCIVFAPEWNETALVLPGREDSSIGSFYLIARDYQERCRWVNCADFKQESASLLPAFDLTLEEASGAWRDAFEQDDIILDVDNKSLTHRPDMWGHRGFAREIAAFMDLAFKPAEQFLADHNITRYADRSVCSDFMPIIVENKASEGCLQYAGFYLSGLKQRASSVRIASRLLKVGIKPRNGIIDLTNYIMLDWSQPVHAYNAQAIRDQKVIIRMAHDEEAAMLLSDLSCTLTQQDLVIADSEKVLCLAGVKGGSSSGITEETTEIFFEAATFDPGMIRKTAQRHKIRTDSSARFEKTLPIGQTVEAVLRFKKLLQDYSYTVTPAPEIVVLGAPEQKTIITIEHAFLEKRSGLSLSEEDIIKPLHKREFVVRPLHNQKTRQYEILVPSHRAAKEIRIKEDILEEVVRCYGYTRVPLVLPTRKSSAFDLSLLTKMRAIKNFCAYSMLMTEQQNYAFYDEHFLKELALSPSSPLILKNPLAEHLQKMVTSLIPGLLKNLRDNHLHREQLAFFELASVWREHKENASGYKELNALAGIMLNKKSAYTFYEGKSHIIRLIESLGFSESALEWRKLQTDLVAEPWFVPYQSAQLWYDGICIGTVGMIDKKILDKIDLLSSVVFAFELDVMTLLSLPTVTLKMKPLIKYQETFFDISLMVPLQLTAHSLHRLFARADDLIVKTELLDFFEREEWESERSLTFRLWLNHPDRTLEKEDIDRVRESVLTIAQAHNTRLRM